MSLLVPDPLTATAKLKHSLEESSYKQQKLSVES